MQQSNQRRPVNCWDAWWVSVTDNTESSSQFFIEISPFNFHDLLKCMFEIFPRPKFANTFTSHSLNNSTFVRNIPLAEETQQSTVQIGSDFSLSWRQLTGRWFVGCNRIEKKNLENISADGKEMFVKVSFVPLRTLLSEMRPFYDA